MLRSKVLYSGPYFDGSEIKAAVENLTKGEWYPSGKEVASFEKEFSSKFNFKSSLMVNSGSSANLVMVAALKKYYGWKDNDEIIVSVVGFPTTVNPIIQNNLVPRFVDITWKDLNWDLDKIVENINERTVAVFSSPVLGNPYDFDKLLNICEDFNIKLISDNCDSLGSKWDGKFLTDYSVASSTSFYPAHHITTLEGGMVSSSNSEIVDIARQFAWWGRDCYCVGSCNTLANGSCGRRFDKWLPEYDGVVDHKYVFSQIGYNLKPLDLQGAIGRVQLKKFDEIHFIRRQNYSKIKSFFKDYPELELSIVKEKDKAETSWFGVPLVFKKSKTKQELQQYLEKEGIQTRNYFAGNLLLHPAYKHLGKAKNYPNAYDVLNKVFFLGTAPCLKKEDLRYVQEKVYKFYTNQPISADGYSFQFE